MGRSEPGGEKKRELAEMVTMVIVAGRREGRQANGWRTLNEKRIKQAKTGLFLQNLCETEHPGDYEPKGFGAFVRDGPSENSNNFPMGALTPKRPRQG